MSGGIVKPLSEAIEILENLENPMNSPVDEPSPMFHCKYVEEAMMWHVEKAGDLYCETGNEYMARMIVNALNARAESPDSVEEAEMEMVREDARILGCGYLYEGRRIDPVKLYCFPNRESTLSPVAGGDLENRVIALMNIIKERRIDPVLGDVEDDIYNTLKHCLAALQHQPGVVISRESAEVLHRIIELVVANHGWRARRSGKTAERKALMELKQSLERKNG